MELIKAKYRVGEAERYPPRPVRLPWKEYEADSPAHALALYESDTEGVLEASQIVITCLRQAVKEQQQLQVGWRGLQVIIWPDGEIVLEGRFGGPWLSPRQTACCGRPPVGDEQELARAKARAREHLLEKNCHCGIYAYHDAYSSHIEPSREVIMQVSAWGVVGIRSMGFRAEEVEVRAVWVPEQLQVTRMIKDSRNRDYESLVPAPVDLIDRLRAKWPEVVWFSGMPGKESQSWQPSIAPPKQRW